MTKDDVKEIPDMASTHVEADFMFPTYSRMENNVLIRSRSGDIDIIVSLVGQEDLPTELYVDNGTGSGRKILQPSLCELTLQERSAVIGFHAFTGNDYTSSFFRKGKKTCWKIAKRNPDFMDFFTNLGRSNDVDDELLSSAEAYVCSLYGRSKLRSVNEARSKIFWDKYSKNKKIVELCMLPPCQANLLFHLKRSNYVAMMMRSTTLRPNTDDYSNHGWSEAGEAIWSSDYIPEEIKDVLFNDAVNNNNEETEFVDEEEELVDEEEEEDTNGNGEEDDDEDVELSNNN